MRVKFSLLLFLSFLFIFSANAQTIEDTQIEDSVLQKREEEFLLRMPMAKANAQKISSLCIFIQRLKKAV